MSSRTFLFQVCGSVSLTFAPSSQHRALPPMQGLVYQCWYPHSSQPACAQPFSLSRFFQFPLSYVLFVTISIFMGSHIYATPFFLRSGVGVFTRTGDFLMVLYDLITVLMFRCLHIFEILWISSERPLMYGSSI